jgi:hypothetical protein
VEIAVNFTKEVGSILEQLSPRGLHAIFERFRGILHEAGTIDKRVQYTIEGLFAVRKGGFKDFPAVPDALDLVDRADQVKLGCNLDGYGWVRLGRLVAYAQVCFECGPTVHNSLLCFWPCSPPL